MKKNLFFLFAIAMVLTLVFSCKSSEDEEGRGDKKEIVVKETPYFDDGILYNGSIAILTNTPVEDVYEAALLRFIGGVTSEVTENTSAVIVEGNPTDFVYEINEVLDRDGAVFFYSPKKEEIKQWADHEDNLMELSPELIDEYDFDKIALIGLTLDGSVYTYRKGELEALEATESEVEPSQIEDTDESVYYSYLEETYDDIYDSSEYYMLGGIVSFLAGLDEAEMTYKTRANGDAEGEKKRMPNLYQDDIEVTMDHQWGDHKGWKGIVGWYYAKGVFSAKFNIFHAFDFDGTGDYYMVDANFQAHCGTFCQPTRQPDTTWRVHTVQGDVLKFVTFEAEPIVGDGIYSVKMHRHARPENVAKEQTHTETTGFNIGGSLSIGANSGKEGDVKSKGKNGDVGVEAGFTDTKSVTFVTKEWDIVKSSASGSTVGYSISTSQDLESTFKGTTKINIKPNARGTIDINANWIWNVPQTKKNTYTKGIEKIRVNLKNFRTKWFCVAEDLISETEKEQTYSDARIEIPLLLTNRTEYGAVKIINDLPNPITGITIVNSKGKQVYSSQSIAVPNGSTYVVSLPTEGEYSIMLESGKNAEDADTYQYIKRNGRFLTVNHDEAAELRSSVNFSSAKDATSAIIILKNTKNTPINYVKLIDFDTKTILSNTKSASIAPGSSMKFYVDPKKKYTLGFACKGLNETKAKSYKFAAPEGEDQFVTVDALGDIVILESEQNFE